MKQLMYKFISEKSKNIKESSLEKIINSRRADVYFKLSNNKEIVIEVQHSNISVKEIKERTKEYNDHNIFILWILDGMGNCVISPKVPADQKNIKISPVEKYLHQMYGGRVYYVKLTLYEDQKMTITPPFALHFSISDDYSQNAYHRKFNRYYIRNSNVSQIPSWNLLCTQFLGVRIARFYDRNINTELKERIYQYILANKKRSCENCGISFKKFRKCSVEGKCQFKTLSTKKLSRKIVANFSQKYGNKYILDLFKEIMF